MKRCAIVTGASSGIGKATALELHQNGWNVYAGARRTDRMEPLADKGISSLSLDVTSEDSMATFVQNVLDSEAASTRSLITQAMDLMARLRTSH